MAKKIIFSLFVLSVLFLGFTVGRYTNFVPTTKASWAAKSNQEFAKLDETEVALAMAIAASSPDIAKEMIKYMKRGNVTREAMQNIVKLAKSSGASRNQQKQKRQRPTFEEEMKEVNDFKLGPNAFTEGKKNAPIQVVTFTEFLCPYCSRIDPILAKLQKEYGADKVAITFQSFIVHGERAEFWHRFAYAAGKQGKFFEVAAELFATQREWARVQGDERYTKVIEPMAKKLGLNFAQIKKDMEDEAIKKQLTEEGQLARSLGIRGTPNVFVNGRSFRGARDEAFYRKVIEQLLKASN